MNKECKVGIIMGSTSDLSVMSVASELFRELGISYEERIVSAHRTPERLREYAMSAKERGLKVIIAGAGGAAPRAASNAPAPAADEYDPFADE
jgi:5-(carboxyamino)imidazole ribonucleotide mutase